MDKNDKDVEKFLSLSCKSCGYEVEDDYVLRMFWEEMFKSGTLLKMEDEYG